MEYGGVEGVLVIFLLDKMDEGQAEEATEVQKKDLQKKVSADSSPSLRFSTTGFWRATSGQIKRLSVIS